MKNSQHNEYYHYEICALKQQLKIADRSECLERQTYITLKYRKNNVLTILKCEVIHPKKSELNIISKFILASINSKK